MNAPFFVNQRRAEISLEHSEGIVSQKLPRRRRVIFFAEGLFDNRIELAVAGEGITRCDPRKQKCNHINDRKDQRKLQ